MPRGTRHVARDKRLMCCTWFAHDCAMATQAYVLDTVLGAERRCKNLDLCAFQYHLVGLVVRRPPREQEVPGSNPACAGIFSGSSHTSDLKIGTPVATLPGTWRYRVSTGTGRPGVSILWLGEVERLICNFYLSVVACKIVCADLSLKFTSVWKGTLSNKLNKQTKQPFNVPLEHLCWRQVVAQLGDCQQSRFAPFNAIIIIVNIYRMEDYFKTGVQLDFGFLPITPPLFTLGWCWFTWCQVQLQFL